MKRAGQDGPLTDEDGVVPMPGERLHTRSNAGDAGGPDEDHLHRRPLTVERRHARRLERFALAPVRVTLNGDVDEPERELARALDFACEADAPGARSVERPPARLALLERRDELPLLHELKQRGSPAR